MSAASTTAIFTDAVTVFWGYITSLIPSYILFGLGIGFVSVVIYLVIKAPRRIVGN